MSTTHHIEEGTLQAYLDNELSSTEYVQAAAHLAGCAGCRATLEEVRSLTSQVESAISAHAPTPNAQAAYRRIFSHIASRPSGVIGGQVAQELISTIRRAEERKPRWRFQMKPAYAGVALGVVMVAVFALSVFLRGTRLTANPTEEFVPASMVRHMVEEYSTKQPDGNGLFTEPPTTSTTEIWLTNGRSYLMAKGLLNPDKMEFWITEQATYEYSSLNGIVYKKDYDPNYLERLSVGSQIITDPLKLPDTRMAWNTTLNGRPVIAIESVAKLNASESRNGDIERSITYWIDSQNGQLLQRKDYLIGRGLTTDSDNQRIEKVETYSFTLLVNELSDAISYPPDFFDYKLPPDAKLVTRSGEEIKTPAARTTPIPTLTPIIGPSPSHNPSPSATPGCSPWTVVESPNVNVENQLLAVEAISERSVWAVGYHATGSQSFADGMPVPRVERTLIMFWDGNRWQTVPSPNAGGPETNNKLVAISAVSESDIWAVGSYGYSNDPASPTESKTLILHWDGSSWEIVDSPDAGKMENRLLDVAALATNDVWAVGWYSDEPVTSGLGASTQRVLILHWNGARWEEIAFSPNPGTYGSRLTGVHASSADDVWAVGTYSPNELDQTGSGAGFDPFLIHWDGNTWKHVPVPGKAPDFGNLFSDIGVATKDQAWAVGSFASEGSTQAVMLRWDSKGWSPVALLRWDGNESAPAAPIPSPSGIRMDSSLTGIEIVAPDDVWAVGSYGSYGTSEPTGGLLFLHWDGKNWQTVAAPTIEHKDLSGNSTKPLFAGLNDISATAGGNVWAVGVAMQQNGVTNTLIMRYTGGECPKPTP